MITDLSIKHLGQLIDLSMKASHFDKAQLCLDEMQSRLDAVAPGPDDTIEMPPIPIAKKLEYMQQLETPAALTTLQVEAVKPLPETPGSRRMRIEQAWEADGKEISEPEPSPTVGPPCDAEGNVTRVSTQVDDPGYDPEIHLNQDLKIFCGGKHIPTAHTADIEMGICWYYEKDARGRIKTKELHGKVEIKGLK